MARRFESREAVSRARAVGYDAVVLDARLPGEDGFEVCRRLRGEHAEPTGELFLRHPGEIIDDLIGLRRSRRTRAHPGLV